MMDETPQEVIEQQNLLGAEDVVTDKHGYVCRNLRSAEEVSEYLKLMSDHYPKLEIRGFAVHSDSYVLLLEVWR